MLDLLCSINISNLDWQILHRDRANSFPITKKSTDVLCHAVPTPELNFTRFTMHFKLHEPTGRSHAVEVTTLELSCVGHYFGPHLSQFRRHGVCMQFRNPDSRLNLCSARRKGGSSAREYRRPMRVHPIACGFQLLHAVTSLICFDVENHLISESCNHGVD